MRRRPTPSARRSTRVLGPPTRLGRRRARLDAEHVARGGREARGAGTCCCRRCRRCRSASAGSAPAALNYVCAAADGAAGRRLGVATFYALLAVEPRPRARRPRLRRHRVQVQRPEELIAELEERLGAEGELDADGSATWLRSPCLGQCDRAPAAMLTVAGEHPRGARRSRPSSASGLARGDRRHAVAPEPATPRAAAGDGACACCARVGHVDPDESRRLPRAGRLRRAAARARARAARASSASSWTRADGPRRRRVPDRREVGRRRARSRRARTT